MGKLILAVLLLIASSKSFAQKIENLNGFSHFQIAPIKHKNGEIDMYRLMPEIKNTLIKMGLQYEPWKNSSVSRKLKENPCISLTCLIEQKGVIRRQSTNAKVRISFYDCNNNLVFQTDYKAGAAIYSNLSNYFRKAVNKTLKPVAKFKYKFNSNLTPQLDLPEVEKTLETEETLMSYYDSNRIDDIEGIYKSYKSEHLGHYKIGIKKFGYKYKAIILESEASHWKVGEVKAIIEPSSVDEIISIKWFMGNKTEYETFGTLEAKGLLSVEFTDNETKLKRQDKFIKMYPSRSAKTKKSNDSMISTGSGFLINSNGTIATNAHVVDNAERIQVTINNGKNKKTYNAKVLLQDKNNDVALLKINDSVFSKLKNLPYKLVEDSDIGEKVFTIGFPLNSIMGNNYKVNNGIVNASTGISDDIRQYQISIPLQPGNSGGPLFNEDGNIIGITTASLNEKAIGTKIQNVNYAVKSAYIMNLANMLPKLELPKGNDSLKGKDLKEKVKILRDYVCLITVY